MNLAPFFYPFFLSFLLAATFLFILSTQNALSHNSGQLFNEDYTDNFQLLNIDHPWDSSLQLRSAIFSLSYHISLYFISYCILVLYPLYELKFICKVQKLLSKDLNYGQRTSTLVNKFYITLALIPNMRESNP